MSHTHDPSPALDAADLTPPENIKVLLVDDEERFRTNLAERLQLRGFQVLHTDDGEKAIRIVRSQKPDVVLLDRKMPKVSGEEVLKEIKAIAPEVQIVMLTGHASMESATAAGKMDAFRYLEKPCETDFLIQTLQEAYQEKQYSMHRHEIVHTQGDSIWTKLWGAQNSRPGILLLGALLFALIVLMPTPDRLTTLLSTPKGNDRNTDIIGGYGYYAKMKPGQTIVQYHAEKANMQVKEKQPDGTVIKKAPPVEDVATQTKVMIGILVIAALFWATGAMPIGFTALLVGVLMYLFKVFPPDLVAQSFAKDSVIFIMGILAFAVGIGKTGLDKRIGLMLLSTSKSLPRYLFIFLPLLAVTAGFLSEHALVAFIAPILMIVYMSVIKMAGLKQDKSLAVLLILSICFAANQGGPGSPAAGGRNAVMIGILADYGMAPTFGQWVMYGLPFVPVMALVIATYFYLRFRRQLKVSDFNAAEVVKRESTKIGRMTGKEYITAAFLALTILLWITASDVLGMGGPVMLGLVGLAVFRIVTWRDVNKISWDVVALYASATAMGAGLASTGGALWLADAFVTALPESMSSGTGLCIASSLFTGVLTNFMSDGATVSAIGPITVPMASISGTHPWAVGFATAFASSFANALIIGTPNNAIAYSLAKDSETGEQLVSLGDFFKHGVVITVLSLLVLWGWAFMGYWKWIGF